MLSLGKRELVAAIEFVTKGSIMVGVSVGDDHITNLFWINPAGTELFE
jgi:hypothetical protein